MEAVIAGKALISVILSLLTYAYIAVWLERIKERRNIQKAAGGGERKEEKDRDTIVIKGRKYVILYDPDR